MYTKVINSSHAIMLSVTARRSASSLDAMLSKFSPFPIPTT